MSHWNFAESNQERRGESQDLTGNAAALFMIICCPTSFVHGNVTGAPVLPKRSVSKNWVGAGRVRCIIYKDA